MHGVRSLSNGLLTGLIITATVFGALVLSMRGQPTSISELPIPTVTLQIVFTLPTPAVTPTRVAAQATSILATAAPSETPTSTPTICPIPPAWQRYIVGPFDTLISIAQRFNLTPDQLAQTNCLDRLGVTVGQTIFVPSFKPTPTSVACFPLSSWVPYIVRPGDTLGSIALRYGVSVYTLMRANCLSTTYIYYGQMLYVPPIYPVVTFAPTPIIPTFTPTPPIISLTPTPSADTPTLPADTPTPPAGTPTPPADTPTLPADTPTPPAGTPTPPAVTPTPPAVTPTSPAATPTSPAATTPANTPAPIAAPTEAPLPTNAPEPPPTATTSP